MGRYWRLNYHLRRKDFEAGRNAFQADIDAGHRVTGFFVWPYFAFALATDRMDDALTTLNAMAAPNPSATPVDVELVRAYINVMLGERTKADSIYRRLLGRCFAKLEPKVLAEL